MSTRKRGENPERDDEDDKKTSSAGDTKDDETVVEFDVPKELLDTKEDLKRIIVLLDKLDARNVFQTDWKKDMREIKDLVEKINYSGIGNRWEENLAHKPIEMVTYGGRGHRYVDVWRLIGPNGSGQTSFFRYDKGNLVQTMPKEPYIGDGNDYSPPRFHSYRTFISQLINNIDATIEALVEEHLQFAPGGIGYNQAATSFGRSQEATESTVVAPQTRPNVTPQAGISAVQQSFLDSFLPAPSQEVSSYQDLEDSRKGSKGGRRKRKTKRRKRKTKRRKTRGKTKRKRKRRKHRRKSKHTKR